MFTVDSCEHLLKFTCIVFSFDFFRSTVFLLKFLCMVFRFEFLGEHVKFSRLVLKLDFFPEHPKFTDVYSAHFGLLLRTFERRNNTD